MLYRFSAPCGLEEALGGDGEDLLFLTNGMAYILLAKGLLDMKFCKYYEKVFSECPEKVHELIL